MTSSVKKKLRGVLARGTASKEYINFFIGATLKNVKMTKHGFYHRLDSVSDEPYKLWLENSFRASYPRHKVPKPGEKVVRVLEVFIYD